MRKILAGIVSGVALLGLAACGDTDETTTQGIEEADPAVQEPLEDDAAGTGAADTDAGEGEVAQ